MSRICLQRKVNDQKLGKYGLHALPCRAYRGISKEHLDLLPDDLDRSWREACGKY